MNECGEDIPRFVSHYLDELPPVSFDSIDVSSLLRRMEQLSVELCSMKHALQLHVNVGEDLRAITVDINQRVCALEQLTDMMHSGPHQWKLWIQALAKESSSLTVQRVGSPETMDVPAGLTSSSDSPKWSHVVKKGRRQGFLNADSKTRSPSVIPRQKKKSSNVMSVVGPGAVGNI